jgi:alginate O-acetyltransferase complex protein AlgI
MLFNSVHFVLFFFVVTTTYFAIPHKYRWLLLLLSSCYFYMVFLPIYILILGFTIIVDYFAGILLEETHGKKRKYWLLASLIANIGVLAVFKYYNFLTDNLSVLFNSIGYQNHIPHLGILLPIGLSFHTFQAMSYTIEVYRGHQKAERNFGIYSLYVMFYPQLVAGPIERPQNLLHQFYEKHEFDLGRIIEGLKMMLWGFFMKLVVADRLAIYVNAVYNNPDKHNGTTLLIGTIFFAFQIYCDFAGYSNIAIGAAKVMGFTLMTNFNRPYFSKSISEFWKRWHISLSSWFKDYLYISLGGNRVGISRWYLNLFLVFTISGLWHGANWTFILWGAINGSYLVFAIMSANYRKKLSFRLRLDKVPIIENFLQITITFFLSCFAWILFRANSIDDAFLIYRKILIAPGVPFDDINTYFYSLIGLGILFIKEIHDEYFPTKLNFYKNDNPIVSAFATSLIIIIILSFGVFDGGQFIYFQF